MWHGFFINGIAQIRITIYFSSLKLYTMIVSNYLKKIIGVACFMFFITPLFSNATPSNTYAVANLTSSSDSLQDSKMAAYIVQRVSEIQAMDLSSLSPAERKALRKELKQLKRESDGLDSRIYISVGAAIIIILLLILILR